MLFSSVFLSPPMRWREIWGGFVLAMCNPNSGEGSPRSHLRWTEQACKTKGAHFLITVIINHKKKKEGLNFVTSIFRLKAARRLFPSLCVSWAHLAQLCSGEELQPLPRAFGDDAWNDGAAPGDGCRSLVWEGWRTAKNNMVFFVWLGFFLGMSVQD